ncbi:MAG: adenylate/guanylate cyclase domain-containing protein [Acidimicrobiales bacterium]|nr:adenylate/guanylate cyclase domain-containing protein [Acidimicrobiales bacterium]
MARYRRRRQKSARQVLESLGVPPDEITDAEESGTAELLAIDRLVLPERGRYTVADLARKVDADPDVLRVLWRSLGFVEPMEDEPAFTKSDVRVLETMASLADAEVIDPALSLQIARVLGQSMSQIATAVVDAVEMQANAATEDPGARDSVALRAGELLPFLSQVVDYSFKRHLRAAARRRVDLVMDAESGGQVVGFVDLVRFTELSLELDDADLAVVVGHFDLLVQGLVVEHGGRVVKMIGDAAMFTVADPVAGAGLALALQAAVAEDPMLNGVRVGMAYGPILTRDGDLYGPVVNLANRLVGIGRSGAINVSQDLRDALAGDRRFSLRSLGTRSLRHIGEERVYRLRPGSQWSPAE